VSIQVDEVQSVPDGFGFHLKASEYTWITLVFETKEEAAAAHSHAAKAVAHAKALKIVIRGSRTCRVPVVTLLRPPLVVTVTVARCSLAVVTVAPRWRPIA